MIMDGSWKKDFDRMFLWDTLKGDASQEENDNFDEPLEENGEENDDEDEERDKDDFYRD